MSRPVTMSTTNGFIPDTAEMEDVEEEDKGSLRPFVIVSTSYLLYTITDGAVRMIVLLHAYNLGFTAMEVGILLQRRVH